MLKGKLADGYEFEISEQASNDWEILEAIDELDENPQRLVMVAKRLLGDKGYKKLKEKCRVDGIVPLDAMSQKVFEILESCNELKNS